jgi:hypothetical protein
VSACLADAWLGAALAAPGYPHDREAPSARTGDTGAPLRHLDPDALRAALSRLLRQEWEDGFIIYQLVVEGTEPALVAAERGVSRLMLTEELRDAKSRRTDRQLWHVV